MHIEETERLLCKSEMRIINGLLEPAEDECSELNIMDILNRKPATGMEYGFMFYDKETEDYVCQIHFEDKRRKYEVSYGTEEQFRGRGFMKEALNFFVKWVFDNTEVKELVALIHDNNKSQHILENSGFTHEKNDEYGDWFIIKK